MKVYMSDVIALCDTIMSSRNLEEKMAESKWFAEEQAYRRIKRARKLFDMNLITKDELVDIKKACRRELGLPADMAPLTPPTQLHKVVSAHTGNLEVIKGLLEGIGSPVAPKVIQDILDAI